MHRFFLAACGILLCSCFLAGQYKPNQTLQDYRTARNEFLTGDLSPLSLVHREALSNRTLLRIVGPVTDLPLPGLSPEKAAALRLVLASDGKYWLEGTGGHAVTTLDGRTAEKMDATSGPFRLENYVLHFRPTGLAQGAVLDVYDLKSPAKRKFRGVDTFPPTAAYVVQAQLQPVPQPLNINLIDSHGFARPYWIYGHLAFRVDGRDVRMEVYTATLDEQQIARDGFMLIFADQTSGQETYSSGRYLYIEGKPSGNVTVDFNKAYNPPCSFSAVFTCPFARKENRLPVAIRAGEKTYTGPGAVPLRK